MELSCLGKIFYYVGLILYMVCDTLFDWWTLFDFVRPYADKEEFKVDTCNIPFFISSFAGLIINIRMLTVYWHYIKFHWDCFFDGYSERCYKDHLRLNRLELWLSVVELVLKDDIQSVIVYLIYASHLTGSTVTDNLIAMIISDSIIWNSFLRNCNLYFCSRLQENNKKSELNVERVYIPWALMPFSSLFLFNQTGITGLLP